MTGIELFAIFSGFIIGSGIDAASRRFETGTPWLTHRSRCDHCQRPLRWFELVPVVSWLALRGRCRTCKASIGWSAPLTECAGALAALVAVALTPRDVPYGIIFSLSFGWLLLALAAIDRRHFILPDVLNAALLAAGAIMVAVTKPADWPMHLAGAATGFGLLWLVEIAYRRLRGIDGLGRGDAKLLGAIGAWVGLIGIPSVLLIASVAAIAGTLIISLVQKQSVSGKTPIAFGPWIALAGFTVWLLPPPGWV
ncbi:prepilin peptidase [Hyphomonas sp.]|uniref:prepilin peptidase n=1 Tax=Hyphomonas sp. TaxID=87 RepID=UPI00391D913C